MKKRPSSTTLYAGHFEFVRINKGRWDGRDLYHWLLTLRWPWFALVVFGIYITINLIFAVLFWLAPNDIAGMQPGSFSDAFFFSVETLATVGYGHLYPATLYGHLISMFEIMVGMFGLAAATGLIFIRFSRPTARIIFSRNLVIAPFNGTPALMMRVANLRDQAMAEAEFRMMMIRNEETKEGEVLRRFYPLRLQFERLIIFPAALTIRHVIDETSPLHGATPEVMERNDTVVMASVVCIDTVIPAPVQSQATYTWRGILFGRRFVEIYTEHGGGRITVDYGRLHDTETVRI